MPLAPPSMMSLSQRLNATIARWRGLILLVCNPYRPELHYMRGPGPKWRAKHHATHQVWLARRA